MIFFSSAHFYLIVIFPIKIFLYISEPNLTLKFPSRFLLSLHCLISSRQIFGNLICNTHLTLSFRSNWFFEAVSVLFIQPRASSLNVILHRLYYRCCWQSQTYLVSKEYLSSKKYLVSCSLIRALSGWWLFVRVFSTNNPIYYLLTAGKNRNSINENILRTRLKSLCFVFNQENIVGDTTVSGPPASWNFDFFAKITQDHLYISPGTI